MKESDKLKELLDKLYVRYNRFELIKPDPLQFAYRYSRPADIEIAALLSASLAYGQVRQIEKSLTDLFGRMGKSPFEFVMTFDGRKRKKLEGFKHRFTAGENLADLFEVLRKVLNHNGSLEKYFLTGYDKDGDNVINALANFCDSLLKIHVDKHGTKRQNGLKYLLASPSRGSACKRMNLFLRWMVRDDDVDTGLWKSVDKSKLIVPVDVHMARLCRILGFYKRNTASLSSALEITAAFVEIEPKDPVKYDFALSRIGILENCTGRMDKKCEFCELFIYCLRHKEAS